MTYNYHPNQLFAYELANERLRQENEEIEAQERGEATLSESVQEAFEHELQEEEKKLAPGEKISLEKLTEVFQRVSANAY